MLWAAPPSHVELMLCDVRAVAVLFDCGSAASLGAVDACRDAVAAAIPPSGAVLHLFAHKRDRIGASDAPSLTGDDLSAYADACGYANWHWTSCVLDGASVVLVFVLLMLMLMLMLMLVIALPPFTACVWLRMWVRRRHVHRQRCRRLGDTGKCQCVGGRKRRAAGRAVALVYGTGQGRRRGARAASACRGWPGCPDDVVPGVRWRRWICAAHAVRADAVSGGVVGGCSADVGHCCIGRVW